MITEAEIGSLIMTLVGLSSLMVVISKVMKDAEKDLEELKKE